MLVLGTLSKPQVTVRAAAVTIVPSARSLDDLVAHSLSRWKGGQRLVPSFAFSLFLFLYYSYGFTVALECKVRSRTIIPRLVAGMSHEMGGVAIKVYAPAATECAVRFQ